MNWQSHNASPLNQTCKVLMALLLVATLVPLSASAAETWETVLDEAGRPIDDLRYESIRKWEDQEKRGLSLYKNGDYAEAYELLTEPARHGLKRAQHSIALMHIQGQSVDKNILIGTALFGLAASWSYRPARQSSQAVEAGAECCPC